MFRKVTISRSIRTLGTMLANGVPIMDAIRLAGQVSGNYFYEELWEHVLDEVDRRQAHLRGPPRQPALPPRAGADDRLPAKTPASSTRCWNGSAPTTTSEVETSLKATTSMIEPIMISVMGVVVGTIGLALMLPIFSLSKQP